MRVARLSDIKLGWLQRFCSAARHQSLIKAAKECGVDPTCVSDSIQSLQQALQRPLMPSGALNLTAFGRKFLYLADSILESTKLFRRNSANITVGYLQVIIEVSRHKTYVATSQTLGLTRFKVMRSIKELEGCTIESLVDVGNGRIRLSPKGEDVVSAAQKIVNTLGTFCGPPLAFGGDFKRTRKQPWWFLRLKEKTLLRPRPQRRRAIPARIASATKARDGSG